MLSQIEKRLDEKKKKLAQPAKPWSATLPAKDEGRKPNYHPNGVTRGAPPPGFRNHSPAAAKPKKDADVVAGSKVMGARVDPQLYAALERFKKERKLPSLREALTTAAAERLGVR